MMKQLALFDVQKVENTKRNKYKGLPGKMCSQCKHIFAVDHPHGRKFYCKRRMSNNLVNHKNILKYDPACFLYQEGSGVIANFYRNGIRSIKEKESNIDRLTPVRWA